VSWWVLLQQALATFVGGGAALAIAGYLGKTWLAHRLEREMEQHRADISLSSRLRGAAAEKQAQVAADALVAGLQFLDTVLEHTLESRGYPSPYPKPDEMPDIIADLVRRRQVIAEQEKTFLQAVKQAEAHLPSAAVDALMSAHGLWRMLRLFQDIWISEIRRPDASGERAQLTWMNGFRRGPLDNLDDVKDQMRRHLRPIVQFQPPPPPEPEAPADPSTTEDDLYESPELARAEAALAALPSAFKDAGSVSEPALTAPESATPVPLPPVKLADE
jgi:hypothetical protein